MKNKFARFLAALFTVLIIFTSIPFSPSADININPLSITAEAASKKTTHLKKSKFTLVKGQTKTQKLISSKGKTITATKVKWKSSNKKIAKINSKGVVTAVKAGKVTLSAKYKNKTYKFTVTVKNPSVSLNLSKVSLNINGKKTLKATTVPSSSTVKWSSSDSSVAKVTSKGVVKGLKSGTAKITATITYKGKKYKDTCKVTVKKPSVSLSSSSFKLSVGSSKTLTATTNPSNATVKWSSSAPSVATVSSKGVVKGIKNGTATITAAITCNGTVYKKTCTVTVQLKEQTLASAYTPKAISINTNSVQFQTLSDYAMNELAFFDSSLGNDLTYSKKFGGTRDDIELIKNYVNLLCDKMNFKLADSYWQEYNDIFFSYGLVYTGNANIRQSFKTQYSSKDIKVNLQVWGITNRNNLTVYVQWASGLEATDIGYRCNGVKILKTPAGKSACAGLKRLADGSFATTDGRLKTTLGNAAVIRNGQVKNVKLEYTKENRLKVFNYYGTESLWVNLHDDQLKNGVICYHNDLAFEKQGALNEMEPTFRIDKTEINTKIDTKWIRPEYNSNTYLDATLRVLYYDKDNIAVFYIYTDVVAPTEFLCAVDLKKVKEDAEKEEQAQQNQTSSGGTSALPGINTTDRPCIYCKGRGRVDCASCIDGFYNDGGIRKLCVSITCSGGTKDCAHC